MKHLFHSPCFIQEGLLKVRARGDRVLVTFAADINIPLVIFTWWLKIVAYQAQKAAAFCARTITAAATAPPPAAPTVLIRACNTLGLGRCGGGKGSEG
jgi:hypothetical protein